MNNGKSRSAAQVEICLKKTVVNLFVNKAMLVLDIFRGYIYAERPMQGRIQGGGGHSPPLRFRGKKMFPI